MALIIFNINPYQLRNVDACPDSKIITTDAFIFMLFILRGILRFFAAKMVSYI
jgi:hypothetical protein